MSNDSAFPLLRHHHRQYEGQPGITLREYFAAQALVGLSRFPLEHPDEIAKRAFQIADAMMSERLKQEC